jgi:ATP-dependent RNA helicase DDX51/DBP6
VLACFGRPTYTGFSIAGWFHFFVPSRNLSLIAHIVNPLCQQFIHFILANEIVLCLFILFQVKEVFDAIAPAVALSVASAVGQSSIADEISLLIRKSKQGLYPTLDEEFVQMEPQTQVDILVATPGRLMDHINMTKGFSLEHLQYLVSSTSTIYMSSLHLRRMNS